MLVAGVAQKQQLFGTVDHVDFLLVEGRLLGVWGLEDEGFIGEELFDGLKEVVVVFADYLVK